MRRQFKRLPMAVVRAGLLCSVAILVGMLATACSKPPFASGEQRATEIKGRIFGMVVASNVDKQGRPVEPRFTFPQDQPQMTVIVQAGRVTAVPLTFTWYQVTDEGERKLFEHKVEVKTLDRAFSMGKNPGTLAAGRYKVTVNVQGETREIEWVVAEAPSGTKTEKSAAAAQGQPPVSGGSGTVASPASAAQDFFADPDFTQHGPPAYGPGCGFAVWQDTDWDADTVDLMVVFGDKSGIAGDTLQISAAVKGTPHLLRKVDLPSEHAPFFVLNPCTQLQDGSDLPGTKVEIEAKIVKGPHTGLTAHGTMTLGKDTEGPRLRVDWTPKKEKYKQGDKINVKVTAEERKSGGPWQSGVQQIQLIAYEPGQRVVDAKDFNSFRGKSCKAKSWQQPFEATYTVPPNPPSKIKLCVRADDFDGPGSERCQNFPTADWEGRLDWSTHHGGPGGSIDVLGHADLVLDDDGKGGLTGTLVGTHRATFATTSCHVVINDKVNARLTGTITTSAQKITINVTDRKFTGGRGTCPETGQPAGTGTIFDYPNFDEGLRALAPSADGSSYQYRHELTFPDGTGAFTLILRRAGR